MLRALTELNQFLSIGRMGGGDGKKESLDGTTPFRLADHAYLVPAGTPVIRPASTFSRLDTREQVTACVEVTGAPASISSFWTRRGPTSACRSRA